MKSTNIFSLLKSLFRRELQTPAEAQSAVPAVSESTTYTNGSKAHKPVASSELSDSRCRAFFTDLRAYLTKELHIPDESISLHDYSNGAAVISTDPNFILGLVLLNTSEGQKNLTDNTVLVMHLGSALYGEPFIATFDKFRLHLLRLCRKHRVQTSPTTSRRPIPNSRPPFPPTVTATASTRPNPQSHPTPPRPPRAIGVAFFVVFPKKHS